MRFLTPTLPVAALAAALLLAACGSGGSKAGGAGESAFSPIAPDTFAVVIGADADIAKTEAAFRKQCAGRQSCTIYGWTEAAAAARGVPLTDPQSAALAVRYVRRAIGQDELLWDCVRFRAARAPCLIKA